MCRMENPGDAGALELSSVAPEEERVLSILRPARSTLAGQAPVFREPLALRLLV